MRTPFRCLSSWRRLALRPVPRRLLVAFLASAVLLPAASFNWPVPQPRLVSTFADNSIDHFQPGIELGGRQPVYPAAEGEIVFTCREGEGYSSFPRGIGSAVVLQHEGGIQSVYAHLETESMRVDDPLVRTPAEGDPPLAFSGDTGAAVGQGLLFMLIDLEEGEFLNPIKHDKPLLYPPLESGKSNRGPVVGRLFLKRGGILEELTDGSRAAAGEGELLAEIYALSTFSAFLRKTAPYRIYLAKNGQAAASIAFESLREQDGRLVVADSSLGFADLFEDAWLYRLGSIALVEGKIELQIKAESHDGSESERIIDLTVASE